MQSAPRIGAAEFIPAPESESSMAKNLNLGHGPGPQSLGIMQPKVYTPCSQTYNFSPGAVFVIPVMQFPCLLKQTGQMGWAPPSNLCHMMQPGIEPLGCSQCSVLDKGTGPEVRTPTAVCEDTSHMATYTDGMACELDVGTQVQKMPAVLEEFKAAMYNCDACNLDDDVATLGNPRQMLVDAELAACIKEQLEKASSNRRSAIVVWMLPAVVDLALSAKGTHVVQKALEVSGVESQIALSRCLHGHVRRLLVSHHGNHVLQKTVVMMPPHAVHFIIHELSFFPGGWAEVVKHRFGCRVVERLLEHCESALTEPIVEAVVAEIDLFAKHPFANYVLQHILEYAPTHRHQVVYALSQVEVPLLAQHPVGSNVVEFAFDHGDTTNQMVLAEAILSTPSAVVEMARSRHGSFTVRRMLEVLQDPLYTMALDQLAAALPSLQATRYGRHIAARISKFGGAM